ncbi:MAG: DUF58 domain-containing protein [Dehalococcoidia bacterium]|nr:DUF58 domain-containing protein [Dehalococcoidia bacterium]
MKRAILLGAPAATCFFFALATGATLYYRAVYALLLALIGSWVWARLGLVGLRVQVERNRRQATVGDAIEERITVTNRSPLPKAWLEVEDQTSVGARAASMVISLGSHSFRSWRATLLAERRGIYSLGPIRVTISDPLGLFTLNRYFTEPEELIVYPRTEQLPNLRLLATESLGEGSVRLRARQATPHASSVRDYHPGDVLSRIHWPTSVRRGQLMVKEFDEGMGGGLWLIPDFHVSVQRGEGSQATDEYAATIAASIAQRYLTVNMPVGLLTYAEKRYLLSPERGEAQLRQLFEQLARARAEGKTSLTELLSKEGIRFDRYATLVVITSSQEVAWVKLLQELATQRVRVVVVLLDAATFGGAGTMTRVVEALKAAGILAYMVHQGDKLGKALSLAQAHSGEAALYESKMSLV